jgi:hypothetical protein
MMVAVAAAALLARWVATGEVTTVGHGCAYADGESYCSMARGGLAHQPFSRRLVVPALARSVPSESIPRRFLALDILALTVAVGAVAILGYRTANCLGAESRLAWASGALTGSLTAVLPHSFHEAFYLPVLTDFVALAFGLVWFALFTSDRVRWQRLAVPVAVLVVLCREQYALSLFLILVLSAILGDRERKRQAGVSAVLIVTALVLALTRPSVGEDYASIATLRAVIHSHVSSIDGAVGVLVNIFFATGLVGPLALIWAKTAARLTDHDVRTRILISGALIGGTAPAVVSLFSGSDVGRIASHGGPYFIVVATALAGTSWRRAMMYGPATIATLVAWHPWAVLRGGDQGFLRLYNPQLVPGAVPVAARSIGLLCLIASGAFVLTELWRQGQTAHSRGSRR